MRSMPALSPWSLARQSADGRRVLLLLVVAALLYGFGMHAARACPPGAAMQFSSLAGGDPCHGDIDVADAACEAHCRTDAQSGRTSLSFDLPAAAPPDLAFSFVPPVPSGPLVLAGAPSRRDTGPPLHILLHRLLR